MRKNLKWYYYFTYFYYHYSRLYEFLDYEITIKSNIEKEEKFKKEIEVYNIKINNYKVSLELLQNVHFNDFINKLTYL